ncbi:MAG: ABC transporter permease subunit [Ignisphaera sp.]
MEYYRTVFRVYGDDVVFSFWISLLSTFVAGALSIIIASYIRLGTGITIKKALNQIYRLPLFIPMVVVAQMMRSFLAPRGYLNSLLALVGLVDLSNPPIFFDWKGLLIGFVWKQLPFMTLIVLSGFAMINDSYIEAAKVVGASSWRIVFNILLPMARSSIAIAFILTFASNIGTFTLPYMLIGGAKPTTLTVDIAHRVTYFGDWGTANALGVVMYMLVAVFSIYYLREMVKRGIYER